MKLVFSVMGILALLIFLSPSVKADVNDFTIKNFHADYVLDNSAVGGSLETYETINVNFTDQNHGILRALPTKYLSYDTHLSIRGVVRDDNPEQYTTYKENGNLVLKIGDPNKTITGEHTYKLYYYQERIINFSENTPEFYWDVNGNDWQQTFEKVSATVKLKNGGLTTPQPICYTGPVQSFDQNCKAVLSDGVVNFETTQKQNAGETLTISVLINGVNFVQPTLKDKLHDNVVNLVGVAIGLLFAITALIIWIRGGRDYKDRGVYVPEYEPPKKLTPAEVGMLADYKVDNKDLTATLIDLAVRGYIKLHEETTKTFFATKRKYTAEVVNDKIDKLQPHEKALLDGVFGTLSVGKKQKLDDLSPSKMTKAIKTTRDDIRDALIDKYGLIEAEGHKYSKWMKPIGIGLIIGEFFFIVIGWGFVVGAAIAGFAFLLAGIFMPRRSHAGVEAYEKIIGLKMYMNVAEKQRLKMMQSVERPYAEPAKTVELFEKLLPFAVALGVEKSWAKQFDGILKESPEWIDSNYPSGFSAIYLANSLGGVSTSFSKSFESSSGASSGGGFSGGGGGGGGGGGW